MVPGLRLLAVFAVVLSVYHQDAQAATCNPKADADIYFLLDSSSSVSPANFHSMLQYVNTMIDALPIGKDKVRVGVFRFNHKAELMIPLNKYYNKAQLKFAVSSIRYKSGGSSLWRAVYYLRKKGFRTRAGRRKYTQNIAFVITDSVSRSRYLRYSVYYARKLRYRRHAELFMIGVRIGSVKELKQLASQPVSQHVTTLKSFSDLTKYSAKMAKILCWHVNKHVPMKCLKWSPDEHVVNAPGSAYIKNIKDSFECSEYCRFDAKCTAVDWFAARKRCVKHRAPATSLKTVHATSHHEEDHYIKQTSCQAYSRTTPVPTTPDPSKLCKANGKADVYILIDASGSVGSRNFKKELAFVDKIIDRLPIGRNKVRVGVYRFSHYYKMMFDLNKYSDAKTLKAAIMKIRYTGGGTRTDRVLHAVRHRGFKAVRGDRPHVHDVIVLVTDGVSNVPRLTLREAEQTKKMGFEIFAVGVQIPTKKEVRKIASKPTREHLAIIKLFHAMNQHAGGIANNICHAINNPPPPPTPDPAAVLSPTKGCMKAYPMEQVAWPVNSVKKKGLTTSAACRDYCMKLSTCIAVDWLVKTRTCEVHNTQPSWQLSRMKSHKDKVVHYLKNGPCFTTQPPPSTTTPTTTTTTALPTMDPYKQCSPEGKGDLYIVLDGSSSVTAANFKHIQKFASMIVDNLPVAPHQIRVGAYMFDSKGRQLFDMNIHINKKGVKGGLMKAQFTGGPSFTHLALREINNVGFTMMGGARKKAPKYILVIMDGTSSRPKETLKEVSKLKAKYNTEVFIVGVGLTNTKEAYDLASTPVSDHVKLIKKFDLMKFHAVDVATKICKGVNKPKPLPTTTTTTTSTTTTTTTTTTTAGPTTTVVIPTMDPYKQCSPEGTGDILFAIDGSSGVAKANFKHALKFASMVVDNLPVAPHQIRVGAYTIDSRGSQLFDMNMHIDKNGVKGDLIKAAYPGGKRFTHLVLGEMTNVGFTMMGGARQKAPKYVVIIMDGSSEKPKETAKEMAKLKAKYNAEVFVVGVGLTNTKEANALATAPAKDHVTLVKKHHLMKLHAAAVATSICKAVNNPKSVPKSGSSHP